MLQFNERYPLLCAVLILCSIFCAGIIIAIVVGLIFR